MLAAKRRHRNQNQSERWAKPARRSSRFIYPKTAARGLHQSRSVLKNQNPQNGHHRARFDWGSGAVCFGASPVAAVFGSAPGSATPPEHRIHCKPAPSAPSSKQDISTLLGIGHFYFALTGSLQNAAQCGVLNFGRRLGLPFLINLPSLHAKARTPNATPVRSAIMDGLSHYTGAQPTHG